MNYVLCILNKEKENICYHDKYEFYDKKYQLDLAINILSGKEKLSFDNKQDNFDKMKELLEKFIFEGMLSSYGEELAEDLLKSINDTTQSSE